MEELYFFQLLPWKLLIFDLGILCSRLTLNFWAPSLSSHVCTAKNTHLDCVRTSLYPLQIAHDAGEPITRAVTKVTKALFWRYLWRAVVYVRLDSQQRGWCPQLSLFLEFECVCFLRLHVSPQNRYISGANAVLHMHQGYLGRVIHVTEATGGAYIACAVCFTRVWGCTCRGGPSDYAGALKMCDHSILQALKT